MRNVRYRHAFPNRDHHLQSHQHDPIMMDDFFHIGQCMMGVKSSLWQPERSLCTEQYVSKPRVVYGKNYDKGLK